MRWRQGESEGWKIGKVGNWETVGLSTKRRRSRVFCGALMQVKEFFPYCLGERPAGAFVYSAFSRSVSRSSMPRRLSFIALFAAWLCASGAMLDVVQVFAWTRMFTRYAEAMPIEAAAVETLDLTKPCPLCLAIRRARDESQRQQPVDVAANAGKIVLVVHEIEPVLFAPPREPWADALTDTPSSWIAPTPVPPPRAATGLLAA